MQNGSTPPLGRPPTSAPNSSLKYILVLTWMLLVFLVSLLLFKEGFLLRRQVLRNVTVSEANREQHPIFKKAIIIIIDALRYDFTSYNSSLSAPAYFQNKLPVLNDMVESKHGKLFEFWADPPTTTMQRISGLTGGSLPTFIEASDNFGSYEVIEDNIVDQWKAVGKKVIFMGDDTWTGLFPNRFSLEFPFPSFDVWDLDTVDRGVIKELFKYMLLPNSWDIIIAHFLGVDHAGHKYGPKHPEMKRKLSEMNEVIDRLKKHINDDTLLLVMGDHGMTMSGDHGGDSEDEMLAALFAFSPKYYFNNSNNHQSSLTVNQIDLVPSISLLLGSPIPFSSLGKLIPDLFLAVKSKTEESYSSKQQSEFLQYLRENIEQVMRYLNTYIRSGGSLPFRKYEALENLRRHFNSILDKPHTPDSLDTSIKQGLGLLQRSREICQEVWIKFDLTLMGSGITLFIIHLTCTIILASIPRSFLLSRIFSDRFIAHLATSFAIGAILGIVLIESKKVPCEESYPLMVTGIACATSVMAFSLALLFKLRKCLMDIIYQAFSAFSANIPEIVLMSIMLCTPFSNSYVVQEADVLNFVVCSVFILFVLRLHRKQKIPKSSTLDDITDKIEENTFSVKPTLIIALVGITFVCCAHVYVRCREEHGPECFQMDFHKPIGTLAKDQRTHWRFFTTLLGVLAMVTLPHFWLKNVCGNLNGHSLVVSLASYAPYFIGLLTVAFWALQGHELGMELIPTQHNLLAQGAFALAIIVIIVCIFQPKLLYLEQMKPQINNLVLGSREYFEFVRKHWKHITTYGNASQKKVFGLGTTLSAPVIVLTVMLSMISMLVLGDGLSPSIAIALASMGSFLFLTSRERILKSTDLSHLLYVPYSSLVGWFLLEQLFFYTTGHQPSFTNIQWQAAFVGFSGKSYGGAFFDAILPALLVGWNTFAARIIFTFSLPLLLYAPIAFWLLFPSMRRKASEDDGHISNSIISNDLEKGEVIFIERAEETRTQLFFLAWKYAQLHALTLFSTMLAACVHRRHLMVWKIFAPRFLFEAVGFLVSIGCILSGFAISLRILSVLVKYYHSLEKAK